MYTVSQRETVILTNFQQIQYYVIESTMMKLKIKSRDLLFEPMSSYGIDKQGYGHRESPFNCYCKSINGLFQKWNHRDPKQQYIRVFSPLERIGRNCQQQVDDVTLFPIARNAQLLIYPYKKASQGLHSHPLSPKVIMCIPLFNKMQQWMLHQPLQPVTF